MGEEEQAIPVGNEALRRAAKKKKKGCRADARYFGWFVWKKFNSVSYKYVKVLSKIKVLKQYLLIWCFVSPSITIISFVRCQFSNLFSVETCFWKTLRAKIFLKTKPIKKILSLHHKHNCIYFIFDHVFLFINTCWYNYSFEKWLFCCGIEASRISCSQRILHAADHALARRWMANLLR